MRTRCIMIGVLASILFFSADLRGQAIVEYGKPLEGLRQKDSPVRGVNPMRPTSRSGGIGGSAGSSQLLPPVPIARVLSVKAADVRLYSRQDEYSEPITRLEPGEKLITLGEAFGNDGPWYMVRTQKGSVGWVSSSGVEEVAGEQTPERTKAAGAARQTNPTK
jgi:hypothetical protein